MPDDPNPNPNPGDDPNPGGGTPKPTAGDEKRFTQAELDAAVERRLARERRQNEEATAKAKQEADAAAAKEQGKWKELAEQHEGRVKELEPKAERYEKALRATLEQQRKDLPAHITALLDRLDPDEQLTWLAENREALTTKPGMDIVRPGSMGNPPPAAGTPEHSEKVKQARQEMADSGRYAM